MASATKIVKHAATLAEKKLASVAPLLLRLLRRSVLGVHREQVKELLGLAELLVLLLRVERGSVKTALADIADTRDKVNDLTTGKATEAATTATTAIETARAAAVASMLAMGLSTARNTTLTSIILSLSNASKTAATDAATTAARSGARRALTRVENRQTEKLNVLGNAIRKTRDAIASEGVRLGVRV